MSSTILLPCLVLRIRLYFVICSDDITVAPCMLKYGRVVAVTVAVTRAVKMEMMLTPVMIQRKQNNLPGIDFGERSPYLKKDNKPGESSI